MTSKTTNIDHDDNIINNINTTENSQLLNEDMETDESDTNSITDNNTEIIVQIRKAIQTQAILKQLNV